MKTIKKRRVWLALALCCAAGCSNDSAHTLSRDYRNINNEVIDGLMTVTSERQARFVNEKIIKPYSERVEKVNKRVEIYEQNTDEKLIIFEMINSESVATFFAEGPINSKRLGYEAARIKRIVDTRTNVHADRLRAGGMKDPDALDKAADETRKEWPTLSGMTLASLQATMNKPTPLTALFAKFPTKNWVKHQPPGFDLMNKEFAAKIKRLEMQP
jgi:hypothetical protein